MPEKIGKDVLGTATAILPDKTVVKGVKGTYVGVVKDVKELVNIAKKLYNKHKVKEDELVIGILPDKTIIGVSVGTWKGMKMDAKEFKEFVEKKG